ncbi:MAG: DUF2950 domain-containing protein [Candidatus Levyibacteriota bacterium]
MMRSRRWWITILWLVLASMVAAATAVEPAPPRHHAPVQRGFASPEQAVEALVAAVRSGDARNIGGVLGKGSDRLIRSGDQVADRQARERFLAAYEQRSRIEQESESKATLLIGDKDWPFPFPVVRRAGKWAFDARSGADEILNRRIGRNELSAIQVCLAYVDAQREYAVGVGSDNGLHAYAMRLVSTPGTRDGLYWPAQEGQPPSPLGPLASKAKEEGYKAQPYHGYYYRILTAQGPAARGGAYDYVVDGRMIGGFALIAYPARWGSSGVMTFIVNHDGIVYQRNLGSRTAAIAASITRFDPDSNWSKAQPEGQR